MKDVSILGGKGKEILIRKGGGRKKIGILAKLRGKVFYWGISVGTGDTLNVRGFVKTEFVGRKRVNSHVTKEEKLYTSLMEWAKKTL